jgi:hypothetical protein
MSDHFPPLASGDFDFDRDIAIGKAGHKMRGFAA